MNSGKIIEHRNDRNGVLYALEYILPSEDIPLDILSREEHWLTQPMAGNVDLLKLMLTTRWSAIKSASVIQFREHLLGWPPYSVVDTGEKTLLRLRKPNMTVEQEGTGDSSYLQPPISIGPSERSQVEAHHIAETSAFAEFMCYFGGLWESYDCAGQFIRLGEEWNLFPEPVWDHIEGQEEWEGSIMFYRGINGDRLLLHRDGRVGWWVFAEHKVELQSENFDDFLVYYMKVRDIPWVLDSYGP